MFLKKKAALELSVTAIVVLIMAIVILGLGIGFIKTMFDKTTRQITDINKDIEKKLTDDMKESTDRIKLDQLNVAIVQGKTKEIYFGLRNELDKDSTFTINGPGSIDISTDPGKWNGDDSVITCYSAFEAGAIITGKNEPKNPLSFTASSKIFISKGKVLVSKIVAKVSAMAPVGSYSCSFIVKNPDTTSTVKQYARTDFMVDVSSES
jgi:hypothetical protein